MADHARLSASAAHRWMACPGSVALTADLPSYTSVYADLGTMAHSAAAYCLSNDLAADKVIEQYAAEVQTYLDFCRKERQRGDKQHIELNVTNALQKLDPDLGGTADYCRLRPSAKELLVVDFKFGTGVTVDVVDNKQLKLYALGALLYFGGKGVETVRLAIHQPRLEDPEHRHVEYTFRAIELLDFAADVAEAAQASRNPNAPIIPGVEQCRWCPAAKAKICAVAVKFKPHRPVGPRITADDFETIDAQYAL